MYKFRILIPCNGSWIVYHTQNDISESPRIAYQRAVDFLAAWIRGTFRIQIFELVVGYVLVEKNIVKL